MVRDRKHASIATRINRDGNEEIARVLDDCFFHRARKRPLRKGTCADTSQRTSKPAQYDTAFGDHEHETREKVNVRGSTVDVQAVHARGVPEGSWRPPSLDVLLEEAQPLHHGKVGSRAVAHTVLA